MLSLGIWKGIQRHISQTFINDSQPQLVDEHMVVMSGTVKNSQLTLGKV